MRIQKYLVGLLSLMVLLIGMSGCSSNKSLRNEDGKEVSLENKNKPTLIFFFTGNS